MKYLTALYFGLLLAGCCLADCPCGPGCQCPPGTCPNCPAAKAPPAPQQPPVVVVQQPAPAPVYVAPPRPLVGIRLGLWLGVRPGWHHRHR